MEVSLLKAQLDYYFHQVTGLLGLKSIMAFLFAALVPHAVTLQVLALLCVIDFGSGVWVAKQMKRLSSSGMRRGLAKILLYFTFILVVSLAENTTIGSTFATSAAIGLLVATELVSIVENLVFLGLPIPYATKVLSVVSTKAENFGFKTAVDTADMTLSYTKDMAELLTSNIPRIKDRPLREALQIYCGSWYTFMSAVEEGPFAGNRDLAWARIRATLDRILVEIQTTMAKSQIERKHQNVFLNVWNGALLAKLFGQCKQVCLNQDLKPGDCVDHIRDHLMLMIYRVVNEAEKLDRDTPSPLENRPDYRIGREDSGETPAPGIDKPLDPH